MPASPTIKWTSVKPDIAKLTQPELVALVKELFDKSADNKLFLASRFSRELLGEAALAPYKKRIVDQFFPARGFGKLNLREAKKAISDYKKATSDLRGTVELMLTYVEQGVEFTNSYGDISEAYYYSLESVLGGIAKILCSPASRPLYPEFVERLRELAHDASALGYGCGDEVQSMVRDIAENRAPGASSEEDEEDEEE